MRLVLDSNSAVSQPKNAGKPPDSAGPRREFNRATGKGWRLTRNEESSDQVALAEWLHARLAAGTPAALFAGLFVIRHSLDVFRQAFLLAGLLKPPDHLLGGLVAARLHSDHSATVLSLRSFRKGVTTSRGV